MKRALITGITGQDGAYLAKLLLEKGYKVFGGHRKVSIANFWRLHYLNIYDKIDFLPFDLSDSKSISKMLKNSEPDVLVEQIKKQDKVKTARKVVKKQTSVDNKKAVEVI